MRMPHRHAFVFALISTATTVVFAAAACSSDSGGAGACQVSSDCPIPESCIQGSCHLECRRDADCADGQTCDPVDFVCLGGGTIPAGRDLGMLGDRGVTPPPGDAGLTFIDSGPGPTADGGPVQPLDAATPPGLDAQVGPPPADAAVPPADGATVPRGHRGYGEDCTCANDCESGFCVDNKLRGARTCTERCDRDNDCPGVDTCLQAEVRPGGGGGDCPPLDLGLDPGQVVGVCYPNETSFPCTSALQCTSGICLGIQPPVPWADPADMCTVLCQDDSKCPSGYTCQNVPGQNGMVHACAPALAGIAPCQTYETCGGVCPVDPGEDEASLVVCAQVDANQPGYCTCTCAHADDCPAGYACQRALESGVPLRPGICTPLAGLICPHEAQGVPPVPMECLSFSCMGGDENTPFYSRCTSTCVDDRDCPAAYRCQAVDDGQPGPDPMACVPR